MEEKLIGYRVQLPESIVDSLKRIAFENKRSLKKEMEDVLTRHVKKNKHKYVQIEQGNDEATPIIKNSSDEFSLNSFLRNLSLEDEQKIRYVLLTMKTEDYRVNDIIKIIPNIKSRFNCLEIINHFENEYRNK